MAAVAPVRAVAAAGRRKQRSARQFDAQLWSARPPRTALPEACVLPACAQPPRTALPEACVLQSCAQPRMALSRARRLARFGVVLDRFALAFLSWVLINASRYKALHSLVCWLTAHCTLRSAVLLSDHLQRLTG